MLKYETPTMEVLRFKAVDILGTSDETVVPPILDGNGGFMN